MTRNSAFFYINLLLIYFINSYPVVSNDDIDIERRVALVIGNSAYSFSPLKNASKDARDMVFALENLNFNVIHGTDLSQREIEDKLDEFSELLQTADVAVFFYAGHGFQFNGENYMIPLLATSDSIEQIEAKLSETAISTDRILRDMDRSGNAVNIMILDACRNNPFSSNFKIKSTGLANLRGPTGSIVAYSTAPGKTASDGNGDNGLYTHHLLKTIIDPGVSIEQFFKKVRHSVIKDSHGRQVPWENSSLLGDFYFVLPEDPEYKNFIIPAAKHSNMTSETEVTLWKTIENVDSDILYQAYLEKYPQGQYAHIARQRLFTQDGISRTGSSRFL